MASEIELVEAVCPNRLALNIGDLKIPYCSNKFPDQQDATVRRAVVVFHGNSRNATGYYQYVLDAATTAGKLHETIILAPHFLVEEDVNHHNPGSDVPFWTNGLKRIIATPIPEGNSFDAIFNQRSPPMSRDRDRRSHLGNNLLPKCLIFTVKLTTTKEIQKWLFSPLVTFPFLELIA
ncbi:hypothetical protein [Scytonema sp. PCC 10023]|uniref:hypothetical protein n=1 Tax=Scytonema sp. PCC 10023 TaxID=1680591 RepID=UPI0039C70A09